MDETTYYSWWALHLRVARGESLNSQEQATYDVGLRQMHQEERYNQDITTLRQARATVAALEAEQARWCAPREQLEAEIVTLEAALSERTRQLLGLNV
jgi:cell division protein FtsB